MWKLVALAAAAFWGANALGWLISGQSALSPEVLSRVGIAFTSVVVYELLNLREKIVK